MSRFSSKLSKTVSAFAFVCLLLSAPVQAHASEPYVTNEFDLVMDVREDYSFYMTHRIAVDFSEASHGVFCYIPLGREYKIDRVNVVGDRFEISKERRNLVIKIGDPDRLVRGPMEYTIQYRCRFFADKNPDYDFLYWNLLTPGGWDTEIGSFSVTVNMPKPFKRENVRFTGGRAGSTELADMDVSFAGNAVTALSSGPVKYGEGITCAIQLPDGYFSGATQFDWMIVLLFVCISLTAVLSFILWFLFGRDPHIVKTVEFYPPDDLTSADAGYIVDGIADKEDIVSMIIYFADKGYLSIEESGGKNKTITLNKLRDLPGDAHIYEHTLFDGLFGGSESVSVSKLKGSFYPYYSAAIMQLHSYFNKPANRIFALGSLFARVAGIVLMAVPMILYTAVVYYLNVSIVNVALTAFSSALAIAGFVAAVFAYDKKYSMNRASRVKKTAIAGIFIAAGACGLAALGIFALDLEYAAIAVVICSLISFFFTAIMRKRTKKGVELLGKLLGFKEFIKRAELDRLRKLVGENPSYFYNILPYAYVFGLSDKWAKNFEGIELAAPAWYSGSDYAGGRAFSSVVFMNSFSRAASAMERGLSIPANSGGGSGGGFGSGGFGGSSTGGGSGGFGGGRW